MPLGLAVAAALATQLSPPADARLVVAGLLAALAFVMGISVAGGPRWLSALVAAASLLGLAGLGVALRLVMLDVGNSDVLTVTASAIRAAQLGLNPYGVGYATSLPPGAPFPYGPLALLWYAPFLGHPRVVETAVAMALLALLTLRGRPIGLAVYALAWPLLLTASDGSNDTSAGLLLLLALVALPRRPLIGGGLLALATAFKPYAIAWLPPLIAWAPLAGGGGFLAVTLVAWAPVLFVWGLPSYIESFTESQSAHLAPFFSLASLVSGWLRSAVPEAPFDALRLVLGAATAVGSLVVARSGRAVVLGGLAVYLVALYTGFWSTFAYLAGIAPIVCWNLDQWVGLEAGRIPWPGDPVGRLTAWADARWPVLAA